MGKKEDDLRAATFLAAAIYLLEITNRNLKVRYAQPSTPAGVRVRVINAFVGQGREQMRQCSPQRSILDTAMLRASRAFRDAKSCLVASVRSYSSHSPRAVNRSE